MTRLIAALAALTLSMPALADTIDFTDAVLARVQSVQNGTERLRVFLNRRLIVERRSDAGTDVEVNGGLDVVLEEHFLREIVKRGTRGKIVAVEGSTNEDWQNGTCGTTVLPRTVYVTFNPTCADKSCAFGFSRWHQVRSDTSSTWVDGHYEYKPICAYGYDDQIPQDQHYFLHSVPTDPRYTHVETFSKKGLMKRPMSYKEATYNTWGGVHLTEKYKYSIRLQLDSEELRRVIAETVTHPGVE